jgi:lysophospholipase L1-like esterase
MATPSKKTESKPRARRWIFRLVLLSPLLCLLVVAGSCVVRIVQIHSTTDEEILEPLAKDLELKQGEHYQVQYKDGQAGVFYMETPHFQPLDIKPGERVIYAFGGSSLVHPIAGSFPEEIQRTAQAEGLRWRVFNYGNHGFDSYSLYNRLKVAVAARPPNLVLIYSGHNDFTYAYWNHVLPQLYLVSGAPLLQALARLGFAMGKMLQNREPGAPGPPFEEFKAATLEPAMFRLVNRSMGLFSGRKALFEKVNKLALQAYGKNMAAMLRICREAKVPVLLVTPVFNLHFRPAGADGEAEELFNRGLAAASYEERTKLLVQAKDADVFSGMIRAKSILLDYLRGLHALPGVSVLQLDKELYSTEQPLDGTQFEDSLHLIEPFHVLVAQHIYKHIKSNGLLDK